MQLKTFSAQTMAEALLQVKSALGSDAVILHTRTFSRRRWMGLRKQNIVEITAGKGLQTASPAKRRQQASLVAAKLPARESPIAAAAPKPSLPAGQEFLQTSAASSVVVRGISEEVANIKSMVGELIREMRFSRAPEITQDLLDYYLNLIQNQVAEELAHELVKSLQAQLKPEHLRNPEFVRNKLAEQLERMLPIAGPIVRTKTVGPHVVALIGPTGVGKTTTVAKLAANLKLRENRRIGLITIDTYRIAAVDQLRKYADILGSPLEVVSSPEELRAAIQSMHNCDFVLIDTAGRAPSDTLKLNELKNFLTLARPDEVHLVLSTTASQECIETAIARFSEVRVDKIIFTKLDEAVHVGVLLNVVRKVNKSLSYITTGQDVPDDIEVGQGRRLAQLILGSAL